MHAHLYGLRTPGARRTYRVRIGKKPDARVWADRDGLSPKQQAKVDQAIAATGAVDVLFTDPLVAASYLADLYAGFDAAEAVAVSGAEGGAK